MVACTDEPDNLDTLAPWCSVLSSNMSTENLMIGTNTIPTIASIPAARAPLEGSSNESKRTM